MLLRLDVRFAQRGFFASAGNANIVNHLHGTGRAGHAGGGAFVLANGRGAFPGDNAALDMKFEAIFTNLRFGQFGADG